MNLDLDRIFGGGRVPDWLRTFAADPDLALHNLVLGRAELGHLTVADPVDLLLGWLRALGNRTDFRAQVDQSLSSWIVRNWGLIELPGGADSATLTSAAWVRVGEVLAAAPTLTAAGDALAQRVLADRRYLNSLCEGRSRDPQAAAWRALAAHQRDRSLLPTWWQLCELPPDQPWYRGHCGIVGLRGLPAESAARAGGFPKEVAEGLNRFGLALWRFQDEGWLRPDLAAEEFQDALRLCLSAYPFPDRWMSFWRHVLRRDYRRGDLGPWIRQLLPRVADDQTGKGSNKPNWVSYDPAWSDHRNSIAEKLRRGSEGAVIEANCLLAAQRRYFDHSGDSYNLAYSATRFSAAVRQGQPAQALLWARVAKEVEPWNSYGWTNEGQALLVLGDRIAALEAYRETKARFPDNAVARNGLAEVLKAQHRFADAEAEYRETKARFPDNVFTRNGLAEVLKAQGQFADAEAEYRETKARFPDNVVAHTGLAAVLKAQDRFADAEAEYRETKTRFPDNVVARKGLAEVLKAQDRFADAEAEYRDLKTAYPESLVPRNNLIFVLKAQGRWDEVVTEHLEAIDLFPENVHLHMGLGAALVQAKRLAEAEAHYRRAQEWFPDEPFSYAKLADILVAQARFSEAEHAYREARCRASDSFAIWVGLARVLDRQGRTEEAEAEYRAMEERFPDKCVPRGHSDEIPDSVPEDTDSAVMTDEGDIAPLETELPGTVSASVVEDSPADVKAPAKTPPVPGEELWLNRREIDIVAGDAFLIRGWARAAGTYDPDALPGRFRERAAVLLQRLLPSVDTDSVAAGESALLELDDGALAEGLALLRRAVQRFPGSARVRYALARAEREAVQGDPITSWRRLLRMDPHYEPIVYLGAGRAWLGRMAQDGAQAEGQAREMFGRLGYWIDKHIEPLPGFDPNDPQAEPRTSYRAQRKGDFSGWWGIEAQAELFGMRPVAGWDDLDDLGPIRERILTRSASLDRLEEDWVRRYARA